MSKSPIFKYHSEDPGFCRVYYRSGRNSLYCIQDDGSYGTKRLVFYRCSTDGEPCYEVDFPSTDQFDKYIEP